MSKKILKNVKFFNHQTTELQLYFFCLSRVFFKQCLPKIFLSIYLLLILSLITSMDSSKDSLLGDFLDFLTYSSVFFLSIFGETFAVALLSYWFYPSVCNSISRFRSYRPISAVVERHCALPDSIYLYFAGFFKVTNFFLSFNNTFSKTNCHIHSHEDYCSMHYATVLSTVDPPNRIYTTKSWRL